MEPEPSLEAEPKVPPEPETRKHAAPMAPVLAISSRRPLYFSSSSSRFVDEKPCLMKYRYLS